MRQRIWVKYGNEKLTIAEAARRSGIPFVTLRWRIMHGVPKASLFMKSTRSRNQAVQACAIRSNASPARIPGHSPFVMALNGEIDAEEYLEMDDDRTASTRFDKHE